MDLFVCRHVSYLMTITLTVMCVDSIWIDVQHHVLKDDSSLIRFTVGEAASEYAKLPPGFIQTERGVRKILLSA